MQTAYSDNLAGFTKIFLLSSPEDKYFIKQKNT